MAEDLLKKYTFAVDSIKASANGKPMTIAFSQGDVKTAILIINITENDTALDLTGKKVRVSFKKSDGTSVMQDMTTGISILEATEGKIQIELSTQTLSAKGNVRGQISISDEVAGLVAETAEFTFVVRESIVNTSIISTDELPIIEQTIEAAKVLESVDLQTIVNNTSNVNSLKSEVETARGASANLAGRFSSVESSLAQLATVSVKQFGAVGDGVTDDTQAIRNAFLKLDEGYQIKFEKNKTYIINGQITTTLIVSKSVFVDFNGSKIKLGTPMKYFGNGLIGFIFDKTLTDTSVTLQNGYFDVSINVPDFTEGVSDANLLGGGGVLKTIGARLLKVDNCHFNDVFFSSAIGAAYADVVNITNCSGKNVGGMSGISGGDRAGDAIYFSKCGVYGDTAELIGGDDTLNKEVSILISNCNFSSYDAVPYSGTAINGNRSGRCGIVVGEYAANSKFKKMKVENSRFNNYQRTVHIEFTKGWNILLENVEFYNFGDAFLVSHDNTWHSIIARNCTFKKDIDVKGMHAGSGYVFYTGTDINYKTENILKFENCQFYGYVKPFRGLTTTTVVVDNCKFEINFMNIEYSRVLFLNSNIKANRGKVDNAIVSMHNSFVEMGYLHDANSNYYFGSSIAGSTLTEYGDLSVFNNCTLKNTMIAFSNGNRLRITNCKYLLDDYFVPKTHLDVAMSGIIYLGFKDIMELFEGNTVLNNKTATSTIALIPFTLNATALSNKTVIRNNTFRGSSFSVNDVGDYVMEVTNNKFFLDGKSITKFFTHATGNLIFRNNYFTGLSSAEYKAIGLASQNYRHSGGTMTEVVSA
jgi:hypothetical protein